MEKKIIVRIILAAWVIIWAIFLIRPFFKKDLIRDYSNLSKLSTEGKRAYVTGPRLYEFIRVCNQSMPGPSLYGVIGIKKDSLEHRRVRYYLYPNIEKEEPEFLLVYGTKNYAREGYKIFKVLDPDRYILRRVK
ncbi:MAG: hypothetical protein NTY34_02195 [Candidatus Omnitrophica bacterium]|nr:hypothetical protein [Candidatus Omnitrophota bacterium]